MTDPALDPRTQTADGADGQLEPAGTRWRLRFVRRLAHPPERVWRALTEPDHLEAWFPQEIRGEWQEGATLEFVHTDVDAPSFEGVVRVWDPVDVLEYEWGTDVLRFELEASGQDTVLTFTDTFTEEGKAARDGAGWHECLDRLAASFDGPVADRPGARWAEIHPRYVERLGPSASTIGPPPGFA